jgi:GTP cyclohydrolase I
MQKHIQAILEQIEPSIRPELLDTPARAAGALKFLTQGYHVNIPELFTSGLMPCHQPQLISVNNIEFYSLCEHHLLPFFGKCHISYLPDQQILGLSKFAEIVDIFAHRLQIQENLGLQIADCIEAHLKPKGLAVMIEAQHLCLMMRGSQKQLASFNTQVFRGEWANHLEQQQFLLNLSLSANR